MAVLAVQDGTGTTATTFQAAAGGGDSVATGSSAGGWGDTVLVLRNGGAGAITCTVGGVAKSVPAAAAEVFPLKGHSGGVAITYSGVTSVVVAAVKIA